MSLNLPNQFFRIAVLLVMPVGGWLLWLADFHWLTGCQIDWLAASPISLLTGLLIDWIYEWTNGRTNDGMNERMTEIMKKWTDGRTNERIAIFFCSALISLRDSSRKDWCWTSIASCEILSAISRYPRQPFKTQLGFVSPEIPLILWMARKMPTCGYHGNRNSSKNYLWWLIILAEF